MLPTIDFSLIGVILAIWAVIKTIWGYVSGALNWITQRALAVLIGSKFWATAAFLASAAILIGGFALVINFALTQIVAMTIPAIGIPPEVLPILHLYIDWPSFGSFISYAISTIVAYWLVCGTVTGFEKAVSIYKILTSGFKN